MDNPIEFVTDAFQGDIEIAGKSIPKIAIVGGGVALIVVFVLLSKRNGGGSAASLAGLPAVGGLGNGGGGDATGTGLGGFGGDTSAPSSPFDAQGFQDTITQQLSDSSSALTDLIAQNNAQQNADLNSQLSSVYDQLASVGSTFSGGYADNYAPLPTDLGSYTIPMDSGVSAYPESSGYSLSSFLPATTNPGSVASNASGRLQGIVDKIKPSNVKPAGTKKDVAKLGAALARDNASDSKVHKLTNMPKQNAGLSGVLSFNKKEPVKSGISSVADKKKPMIPSPVPVVKPGKGEQGGYHANPKPITIAKSGYSIPATIKTPLVSGNSKAGKIPQTKQPAPIKQPSKTGFIGSVVKPQPKQNVKPAPKPAPIPVYQPYIPTFANPFLGFQGYKPINGKVSPKPAKKGK